MVARFPALILCLFLVIPAYCAEVRVSHLHPRVYVRCDAAQVGRGVTVSEMRQRVRRQEYARWRRPVSGGGPAAILEMAMRYLEEGDAGVLREVREFLRSRTFSYEQHDVAGFMAGAETAAAFDWVYGGLSAPERAAILANLVTTAESSAKFLRHGEPDINHNYTYMALNTVAVCGLVLHGEAAPYGQKGAEYLELARRFLEAPGMALDTWNAREGAWAEGSHYTFHETIRNLVLTLAAYRTASDADYFSRIERRYGDFLAKAGRFLIASTRPDLTFERLGDCTANRVLANHTVPLTVEMLAWGLGNTDDSARLRSFAGALREAYGEKAVHPLFDWGMRVFHDPRARRTPSYRTLPLAMRMGAGTNDQIVFRSGWDQDSAQITIVAGDHFTDHQHFDKGHFLMYRRGALIVDGGAYDHMYRPGGHWNEYASRTLAHNGLLVYDPGQRFPEGYGNDGGQKVLRGLQHHSDWNSYLSHRNAEGLNTADVEAYDSSPGRGYHYVRVNLTKAYSPKVTRYDRQFVYLPDSSALVVEDRASAAKADFPKRWLLHFEERPEVDGQAPEAGVSTFPDARLTTLRRHGEFDAGGRVFPHDGTLFVRTLLPAEHDITVVGGTGHEFFNLFSRTNYPVSAAGRLGGARESGRWRIEVSPRRPATDDVFLHILQMGSSPSERPLGAEVIEDSDRQLVGALLQDPQKPWVVLFAAHPEAGPVTLPVTYEISSDGAAWHLLAGLPPSRKVQVRVNGASLPSAITNSQGVLVFRDAGTGRRTIHLGSHSAFRTSRVPAANGGK